MMLQDPHAQLMPRPLRGDTQGSRLTHRMRAKAYGVF